MADQEHNVEQQGTKSEPALNEDPQPRNRFRPLPDPATRRARLRSMENVYDVFRNQIQSALVPSPPQTPPPIPLSALPSPPPPAEQEHRYVNATPYSMNALEVRVSNPR